MRGAILAEREFAPWSLLIYVMVAPLSEAVNHEDNTCDLESWIQLVIAALKVEIRGKLRYDQCLLDD